MSCVLAGVLLTGMLVPTSYNASTLGMVWEMTGICKEYPEDSLNEELAQYGNMEEAINRYGEPYLNSIIWDNHPPFDVYKISKDDAGEITSLYIKQVLKNTAHYLNVKSKFMLASAGITSPLITSSRGVHWVDDVTRQFGALNTERQM